MTEKAALSFSHDAEGGLIRPLADVVAELEARAVMTGDKRCSHAAGILRGKPGGRKPENDRPALVEMSFLIERGEAGSPEEAARLVARTIQSHSLKSTTRRLARKYRREFAPKSS